MLGKRQLPSWMMQKAAAASHVNNSENVDETDCSKDNGDTVTKNVTKNDQKKENSRSKSNLNAKREVKVRRRRRNLGQQDGSDDDITPKKKKKGNRSRDRVSRSSKKKDQNLEDLSHGDDDDDVYPVQVSGDDDMELTVEDLVAIAEQYVKDHENKERQETTRQRGSNWKSQASTETGTTYGSPRENERSSSSEREGLYSSAPTTGELIGTSTSQTDHPAQDMLDVFLGSLLRTTLEKEQKSKSTQKSLEITHEFTRQSQDELVGEERAPWVKKRKTWKDKMEVFLN